MEKFSWAILGLGKIARKFAQDLRVMEGAQLVAVGSRSQERADAFAAEFGVAYASGSYAATFAGPPVDAVYIATPHIGHRGLALMCIERGIPVLCEKPLGLNFTEVETVIRAAREREVYLMEGLWTRFLPSTLKVLEVIASGEIGEVQSVRSDFGFLAADLHTALLSPDTAPAPAPQRNRILNPDLGGGALLDIGIYPQFLSQLLLGEPTQTCAMARLSPQGVDLDTSVTCRHAGGKLSHNYSTVLGRTKTEALILGDRGSIHWHSRWHGQSSFSILRRKSDPPENYYFDYGDSNGYCYEAAAAMTDIRAGRIQNEMWSWNDSLTLHRTLTDIRQQIGLRYPQDEKRASD